MSSKIYVRHAKPNELEAVTKLRMETFGINGGVQSFFPDPESRVVDFPAWRHMLAQDKFADPGRHLIVAVERQEQREGEEKEEEDKKDSVDRDRSANEIIVGSAEWVAPGGPNPGASVEELAAKKAEQKARWPKSLDLDALAAYDKEGSNAIKAALENVGLPEGADDDMWDLISLAVDARHQRKGVGKLLAQWGIDRAAEQSKGIVIVANPTGAPLYRKMGFQEAGHFLSYIGKPYQQDGWIFFRLNQQ
ncbi:acyl-CoA N-acyltransferase [Xylariales sp. PMI_506]|nr:acyl-CoA N-acyltransferase [Xylariales sp. PMI_506]